MKQLKITISSILLTLIVGCSAGVNFKKMEENQLVLGKTTKQDIVTAMGKSSGKGTATFNGIDLDVLNYAYAKVGGSAALPGVTPARSQGLLFKDGVLVGKEYTSSFAVDSTLFDTEKAKSITKGQSREDVVSTMGEARGTYIYQIVEEKSGYALVYMFSQTKGFKSKSDIFVVEFNNQDIVTNTKLSSTGQL